MAKNKFLSYYTRFNMATCCHSLCSHLKNLHTLYTLHYSIYVDTPLTVKLLNHVIFLPYGFNYCYVKFHKDQGKTRISYLIIIEWKCVYYMLRICNIFVLQLLNNMCFTCDGWKFFRCFNLMVLTWLKYWNCIHIVLRAYFIYVLFP